MNKNKMIPISRSPNKQNYGQYQYTHYKLIQPVTKERRNSMSKNLNPPGLKAQGNVVNQKNPNYNIPINRVIRSKNININNLKGRFQPIIKEQNNTFENINKPLNLKENYIPSNQIQNPPLTQKEIKYFQNPQNITAPNQEIKNNIIFQHKINHNFNHVNDGQFLQHEIQVYPPPLITKEFQMVSPLNNPHENNAINNERIDEFQPEILTTNKNEQTNLNKINNIIDNNKNKNYITNNINYKNNNIIDNNSPDFENKLKKAEKKMRNF